MLEEMNKNVDRKGLKVRNIYGDGQSLISVHILLK